MSTLLLLALAVAVGDRKYDPEITVSEAPYRTMNAAICFASTGDWVVDGVGTEKDGGTHATSYYKETTDIQAVFSVYPFHWDLYYDHGYTALPLVESLNSQLCWEWENYMETELNVCIDYRLRPDLLPMVCR